VGSEPGDDVCRGVRYTSGLRSMDAKSLIASTLPLAAASLTSSTMGYEMSVSRLSQLAQFNSNRSLNGSIVASPPEPVQVHELHVHDRVRQSE